MDRSYLFAPIFACKVEEASRLLTVKEQRRVAAATFPVLRVVNSCPESLWGCKP